MPFYKAQGICKEHARNVQAGQGGRTPGHLKDLCHFLWRFQRSPQYILARSVDFKDLF